MSAIVTCTTKFKNQDDLVEALKMMGIDDKYVQVAKYGETVGHKGYGSQKRQVQVNISKRYHRGYGDVGFCKTADGTFEMIHDDMDMDKLSVKAGGEFGARVQQYYTAAVAKRTLKAQGFIPKVTEDKDKIRVRAVSYA